MTTLRTYTKFHKYVVEKDRNSDMSKKVIFDFMYPKDYVLIYSFAHILLKHITET